MGKTHVGIPTYNGAGRLGWLLHSIFIRPPHPDSITVVDDGSPSVQSTRDMVNIWRTRLPIDLVEHGGNRGISAAWNTATRAVMSNNPEDITILANDDVIVSSGWHESLSYCLRNSPGVGVVGQSWHAFLPEDVPKLLESEYSDREVTPREPVSKAATPSRREQYEDTNPGRIMCPTGQLFAFRRLDFDSVGGFDEGYRSFYEESDFGTTMAKYGLIGAQINWPFCWHQWSATFAANPELDAGGRINASRARYRGKWGVPDGVHEFDHTNATYFRQIGDVPIGFLRRTGPSRGILRQDGAFIGVQEGQ